MNANYSSTNSSPRKKPLKLVAGNSPKTSVFEKQLGLVHTANAGSYVFTAHNYKSPRRTIGGYNPPSPGFVPSNFSRLTPPLSPQKSPTRSPARGFESPQYVECAPSKEVCVKIPLHRVRTTFRSVSGFFESLTTEDFDRLADLLSYSAVGGFAVFGETLLQANKQGFLILVPIVLVSVLKIVTKSQDNILVGSSIGQILSKKRVSANAQRLVCQVIILLKALLLMLAAKITASFKLQIDYKSHLEVFILVMLGSLIVSVFVSLFNNITSVCSLADDDSLSTTVSLDYEQEQICSRYHPRDGDASPLYVDDYCVLDTPEQCM